jgi:hypothetical protein
MSDESRYYNIGKDRGADDKSTPLGIFNLADKAEANAAQRGWEAGQSAKEHADAVREALEEAREDSDSSDSYSSDSDYSSSSGSSYSPSKTFKAWPASVQFLVFVLWIAGSCFGGWFFSHTIHTVHQFSLAYFAIMLVGLASMPGLLVALAIMLVIAIIFYLIKGIILLVGYFMNHLS